ncbi:VC0807 family protein [Jongsikchunia kroppenstedtii]|uniref:VC0807 family protein n=1 Tax=Jongsikchunia kroppenstedtii TaxID=1121721 RepID=UPI0003694020|nr:VC0807 family protein [Jongsikchunia kroppenstedtii]
MTTSTTIDRTTAPAPTPTGPKDRGRALLRGLGLDVGLPFIVYFAVQLTGGSVFHALLAGALAAGARTVWVALRSRRLDLFSGFLLATFAIGLALTFATGDARFVLLKDSATSFAVGAAFVGSCLLGRPLAYYAARRFGSPAAAATTGTIERHWYRFSMIWGVTLLADAIIRGIVAYTLPLSIAGDLSQVLMIAAYGGLIAYTVRVARRAGQ